MWAVGGGDPPGGHVTARAMGKLQSPANGQEDREERWSERGNRGGRFNIALSKALSKKEN